MRKMEKQILTTEIEVCVELKCDLCGRLGKDSGWEASEFDVDGTEMTVKVHHETGQSYPNGDFDITHYSVDICPQCFRDKLIPWLRSQGATVSEKNCY